MVYSCEMLYMSNYPMYELVGQKCSIRHEDSDSLHSLLSLPVKQIDNYIKDVLEIRIQTKIKHIAGWHILEINERKVVNVNF